VLLTDGADQELDALAIIIEAMSSLQGEEIRRILTYLLDRYTLKAKPFWMMT
jgi:hypothetical protein